MSLLPVADARPSAHAQWWALTSRVVRIMATKGELVVAAITPVIFMLGFYLPLHALMQAGGQLGGMSYAQFIMPIVILQTMSFTMMSNAQLAAYESATGLTTRLRTMPIPRLVLPASRVSAGFVRSTCSLIAALAIGHLLGFRFLAGVGQAAPFVIFALTVGTVLSIGADALGTISGSPEALSQALTLPLLIFGMLSCGFGPETGFPGWLRPFVRNQPISQFSYAMRDMSTSNGVSWHIFWPALAWVVGLAAVFVPLSILASGRRSS